jgi:hypothetical protein
MMAGATWVRTVDDPSPGHYRERRGTSRSVA